MIGAIPNPTFVEALACMHSGGRVSEAPELWRGLRGLWAPVVGVQGDVLHDLSGYSRDGALTGMDIATDWVVCSQGHTLDFDGTDDYIAIPGLHLGSAMSVITTIRFDDLSKSRAIVGEFAAPGNTWLIYYWIGGGGDRISLWDGSDTYCVGPAVSTWLELAVVNDSHGCQIYFDGEPQSMNGGAQSWSQGTDELRIGCWTGYYLDGAIARLAVYDRALSTAEVAAHYSDPLGMLRPSSGLIVSVPSGTSYDVTIAEAAGVADTVSGALSAVGSVAESASIQDAVSGLVDWTVTLSFTPSIGDAVTASAQFVGTVAEAAALADTVAGVGDMTLSVDEALGVTDAVASLVEIDLAVLETVTVTCTISGVVADQVITYEVIQLSGADILHTLDAAQISLILSDETFTLE